MEYKKVVYHQHLKDLYGDSYDKHLQRIEKGEKTPQSYYDNFSEEEKKCFAIAKAFDWEYGNIFGLYSQKQDFIFGNCKIKSKVIKGKKGDKVIGFYIVQRFNEEWKNECCIKFMFIIPKYRRKGNFTKLLNKLMEKNERVSFDGVESNIMIKSLDKKGFKIWKKCADGRGFYMGFDKGNINPSMNGMGEDNIIE